MSDLGHSGGSRMTDLEEDARREALRWRQKYEELWDAVDGLRDTAAVGGNMDDALWYRRLTEALDG